MIATGDLPPGSIRFHDAAPPPIPPGDYTVSAPPQSVRGLTI